MLNSNLPAQKGLMLFLYEILLSSENHYIQKIKSHGENKLKIELTEDYRGGALKQVNTSSKCARLAFYSFTSRLAEI